MNTFKTSHNILGHDTTKFQLQLILIIAQSLQWQNTKNYEKFSLHLLILITSLFGFNLRASAQIIPDNTLPKNSIVTPNGNLIEICIDLMRSR